MKLIIILLLIAISLSCNEQNSEKEDQAKRVQLAKQYYEELEKNDEAERRQRVAEYSQKLWKEEIKELSKEYGVINLQNDRLQVNKTEIRIWRLATFNEKNIIFQLSENNGKWSANLIEKTISEKQRARKNHPGKLTLRKLEEPKSGWDNLYQKLVDEEILSLPDGDAVGNEVCPDCWVFIVETKVDGKYRIYDYHAPESDKENRESQQVVKIINLVSEEFGLNVFDRKNFLYP